MEMTQDDVAIMLMVYSADRMRDMHRQGDDD